MIYPEWVSGIGYKWGNPKIDILKMFMMEHPIQIDDLEVHTGRTQTHMDDLGVYFRKAPYGKPNHERVPHS